MNKTKSAGESSPPSKVSPARHAPALGLRAGMLASHFIVDRLINGAIHHVPNILVSLAFPRPAERSAAASVLVKSRPPPFAPHPGATRRPNGAVELQRRHGRGPDRLHQRGQRGRRGEHYHADGPDLFPL